MLDLLVAGGTVIDPGSNRRDRLDVGITDHRITAVDSRIPHDSAKDVIDASGCFVSPGWVDMHAHVFWGVNWFAVDADPYCTAHGVTTVVDCGSAGSINFPGLRRYVIDPSVTRVLALVNVAQHGIQPDPGELTNIRFADPDGAVAQAKQNGDVVVGIKVRLGAQMVGENCAAAFDLALKGAAEAETRLMVHIGNTPLPLEDILAKLRPGDIVTHCLHGMNQGLLDEGGVLRAGVRRARELGVIFDLGHARGMLAFDVARNVLAQGFGPDTLSTDAYTVRQAGAPDPKLDLPSIMEKFLALGWSLEEVIESTTVRPARILGWQDRIGHLSVGRDADVTVFRVNSEPVAFTDTQGKTLKGAKQVQPIWTIRAGRAAPARGNPEYRPHPRGTHAGPEPPPCCG